MIQTTKKELPKLILIIDKIISWAMLFTGLVMILYNPIFNSKINIILTVFGLVGLIFSIRDLVLYKDIKKLKKGWLKLHLGKMIGGYISATTAFVVVNNFFPSFYATCIGVKQKCLTPISFYVLILMDYIGGKYGS